MAGKLAQKLREWDDKNRARYSHDIVDPAERKKSQHYFDWIDHGILRYRWHNFAEVAPGMYRANHPNHDRFQAYRDMGIKIILNLRGASESAPYKFEKESCDQLGLRIINFPMSARSAPSRELLVSIMDTLDSLDAPTLMHCKSGADRTSLVSAIYLLHVLGQPVEAVRPMLSVRFVHLKFTKTGILDYVLSTYEARNTQAPIAFKDWVMSEYDAQASQAAFDRMGFWPRLKL